MIHPHRSSGVGLAEVASSRHAQIIVIGSAPGGSSGRIHGGSTSDQLLHGSPVPVAIAPHGYREWALLRSHARECRVSANARIRSLPGHHC